MHMYMYTYIYYLGNPAAGHGKRNAAKRRARGLGSAAVRTGTHSQKFPL